MKNIFDFFSSIWFDLISMGVIIATLGLAYYYNRKGLRNAVAKTLDCAMDYIVIFIFINCIVSAEKYGRNTLHVILMGICCLYSVIKILLLIKHNRKEK